VVIERDPTLRAPAEANSPTDNHGKIETVEMGRGIAACAVVLYHVNGVAAYGGLSHWAWFTPFAAGVDFFFVLSGFIIFHVHRRDFGRPEMLRAFLIKRFVRIYPLLWIVVIGWVAMKAFAGETPPVSTVINSLTLYPSDLPPEPVVVWSLRHEVLFYAAFAALIIDRRLGLAVFGVWAFAGATMMAIATATSPNGPITIILSGFLLQFLIGAGVSAIASRKLVGSWRPFWLGLAAVIVANAGIYALGLDRNSTLEYEPWHNLVVLVRGLAFGLCLYGMLCIEQHVRVPRWGLLLGAASYAIYLVHLPVLTVVKFAALPLGDGWAHVVLFISAVVTGVVLHWMVDRPVTRMLRNRFLSHRASEPAPAL
jgi:exopolysaccharide production protein ExoZ